MADGTTPEPVWETITDPGVKLVVARCTRCFHSCGTYWAATDDPMSGAWEPGRCRCVPAPLRPAGAALEKLVGRAIRSGRPVHTRC